MLWALRGIARTTFIIDQRGTVAKVFPGVKVQGHSAEVLAALRQMKETGTG